MKSKWRRYEVLLPARFNDGSDISDDLIGQAVDEVMAVYDGATYFNEAAVGYWRQDDILFCDSLGLLVVDIPDTAANRRWMKAFKARWKERLEHLEIWMVSYRIDIE
jgi:hypothetical protein